MDEKTYIYLSNVFMVVITTLEWLPALMVRSGNIDTWVTILLFPLLAVKSYILKPDVPNTTVNLTRDVQKRHVRKGEVSQLL